MEGLQGNDFSFELSSNTKSTFVSPVCYSWFQSIAVVTRQVLLHTDRKNPLSILAKVCPSFSCPHPLMQCISSLGSSPLRPQICRQNLIWKFKLEDKGKLDSKVLSFLPNFKSVLRNVSGLAFHFVSKFMSHTCREFPEEMDVNAEF